MKTVKKGELINKILVPVDGSKHAEKALDYALCLAECFDAELEILTVVPPYDVLIDGMTWVRTFSEELGENQEKMLSGVLKKTMEDRPDVRVSKRLVQGRPAEKIVEVADEGGFDLLVMGSRGLGGIRELFLGSVSHRVANSASCPVLIVK